MTIKNLFGEGNAPAVNEAVPTGGENEGFALMRDELADIIEEAHNKLNMACTLADVFMQRYIDTKRAQSVLRRDIEYTSDMVCDFLNAIWDFMHGAKEELAIYANPDSPELKYFMAESEKKIKLIRREGRK